MSRVIRLGRKAFVAPLAFNDFNAVHFVVMLIQKLAFGEPFAAEFRAVSARFIRTVILQFHSEVLAVVVFSIQMR